MNMGLLAADLSLGRPLKESQLRSKDTDIGRQRQHLHPLVSCDLHALELYHKALEDERLKIQVFQRELPFCMQLLDDAIEASREQLEERLTCKLNTPMHEPPATAAATHEFVCNYTSSLNMQKSSLPNMVGEINLRFKRKWTSSSSTSAQDIHGPLGPYHAAASACPTKWLLHQNTSHPTKLTHEGSPSTIKGCIKLQESAVPDEVLPAGADESHKASLVMSSNGKAFIPSCVSYNPTHALQMQNPMQLPSPSHKQAIADTYRMLNKSPAAIQDPEGERQLTHTVPVRSINVATFDANHSPISSYSRSISITNLSPKELQMSPGMSSPLAKASSHGSLTPPSGGVQRKPRRCWSPELHQRFLSALRHLGGCQVATPKQIRELMNVEGLTNDEVKSHLQKFRLHMRRPNGVMANSQSDLQQAAAHHLLVFGHIWVPPEYGEQHQHAANLNINSITDNADCVRGLNVASSSCGPMTVMKSINSNSLINNANHIHSLYSYNDHTANSENDGTAQAPVLRLCQDEYSGDHEMQQSKAMHAPIRLLDEEEGGQREVTDRNVSAYAMCERTSGLQQQVGNNDNDGHHHHHSTLSSTGEHLRHDCDIAMKKKLLASDQSAIKQLLQLHAGAASAIMDDKEHENDHEILRNEDSLEINLSIGCDSGNAKTPLHKMEYNERILSGNSTADVAVNINKSKDDHENIQNDDISRSRGNESN